MSSQAAALELYARQRARRCALDYAQYVEIPGAPVLHPADWVHDAPGAHLAPHHQLFLREIEACARRRSGRLMLLAPPGSAKSSYASVVAATYLMGALPGHRVLMASFASPPAERHSRRARALAGSPKYRRLFGVQPSAERSAVSEWELDSGSQYTALGMGRVTSRRADTIIIDDPVAGADEADSPRMGEKTLDAYISDVCTRFDGAEGSLIIIQTRWHELDLSGQILPADWKGESGDILCRDGYTWRVLCLPAKCERADDPLGRRIGEYLWEEQAGELYRRVEANPLAQRTWSALYQQRPAPEDGSEFKREWFKWYDPATRPSDLIYYGASDYAVTEGDGDWTEHGVFGVSESGDVYVVDWWSGQVGPETGVAEYIRLAKQWKPRQWYGEKGVIETAVGALIRHQMRGEQLYLSRELLPHMTDSGSNKAAKAKAFRGLAQLGMVHLPRNTAWAERLLVQLSAFPSGAHDDAVDVCGMIGRAIDKMRGFMPSSDGQKKKLTPYSIEWMNEQERFKRQGQNTGDFYR